MQKRRIQKVYKGAKREIESEPSKKHDSRVTDSEVFARLIFYGVSLIHRPEREVWLTPLGHLLDQIEIYKQFHGMAQPKRDVTIDEVIPAGLE